MFGLEKKPGEKFAYDLEKEMKERGRGKEILDKVEKRIQEIKKALREGVENEKEFDKLGVLLHGYASLKTVLLKAQRGEKK